jgi:hypothetical protein
MRVDLRKLKFTDPAILQKPEVVIPDDVQAALDKMPKAERKRLIKEIKTKGIEVAAGLGAQKPHLHDIFTLQDKFGLSQEEINVRVDECFQRRMEFMEFDGEDPKNFKYYIADKEYDPATDMWIYTVHIEKL